MEVMRFPSIKRDRRVILMLFKCENDCSHVCVEPNMVNTAIHTL